MNKKEGIVLSSDASELEISETIRRLYVLRGKSVSKLEFESEGHSLVIEFEGGDKIVIPIGTYTDDTPRLEDILIRGQ